MTDISPAAAAPPEAGVPEVDVPAAGGSDAREAPGRARRLMRNPLLRVVAIAVGFALGWGAFQLGQNLWAGRNDNTPIAASSQAPSGAVTVSGHGVTLTFGRSWVNVPTTPAELATFLQAYAGRLPRLSATLKSQLGNLQDLRSLAMYVVRIGPGGVITGTTNVGIAPGTIPPGQLIPQVKGTLAQLGATHEQASVATFGTHPGVLVTYTLPSHAGLPTRYGAQAYISGYPDTPVITVTTLGTADTATTLRQIASTITFS